MSAIATWLRRATIALLLPLSTVAGNLSAYAVALIGIGLFIVLAVRRQLVASCREPLALLFLVAFVVLAVCFAVTADDVRDALSAFNFIMLLLAGPLLWLVSTGGRGNHIALIAWLAFAGAVVALAVVLVALSLGAARGETLTLGPIRIANTAVLLGFLGLIGWRRIGNPHRWLLALGPFIGVAVAALTQSRGPLVAAALAAPVALIFLLARLPRRTVLTTVAVLLVAVAGVAIVLGAQGRFAVLPQIIESLTSGTAVADETTRIRLTLYGAGWQAFQQSPWIGHGWHDMMTTIVQFLPADQQVHAQLPQLHNDVLDFAVAAGVVGILVYLLLLATPIVVALRSARDGHYGERIYGVAVLVACYVGAGLTDLMFGFEYNTALYVGLAAILIGYCRDARQDAQ